MQQWIRETTASYTNYFRHILHERGDNRIYTDFTQIKVSKAVKKFYQVKTLHPILNQFVYGFLIPQLNELDRIRKEYPICMISMDACEGDIPHILGPGGKGRKNVLDVSTLRSTDKHGIPIGNVTWLEKCGESYKKTYYKHVGRNLAENIMLTKSKGNILSPIFSTDMGTESNPDNVRLAIVAGAKDYLNMGPDQSCITNSNQIQFDFRDYNINVCGNCISLCLIYHTIV